MSKKKVLVLCPHPSEKGGVANYYSLVRKHFISEKVFLAFYYTGKEYHKKRHRNRVLKTLFDLFSIIKILPHYNLIVLNPSLDPKAVVRDGVFHFVAKRIFHRKTLVFFRGWIPEFERILDNYGKNLFKWFFNFDKALVLSKQFRKTLILWGGDPKAVSLETTTCEQHEFEVNKDPFKIIFLSRLTKGKGCLEAIQAIEILVKEFPNVKLFMVGEGEMKCELLKYVINHDLGKNVEFTGWLEGEKKYSLLSQCGIMLYPTYYGEGMPNNLLEGMGMGLAAVTRPVAGIPDIFVDGENGFLIESLNPNDFAMKVKFLFQNKDVWQTISERNRQIAKERFEISNVVKRLEQLYFEMSQ